MSCLSGSTRWVLTYAINKGSTAIAKVDLRRKTCTCRRFNLTGIPCMHAIAAIYSIDEDPTRCVDSWYSKNSFEKSYRDVIYGIRMERDWKKTSLPPLSPPPAVKQPNRPRKLQIKEVGEIPNKARRFARMNKQYICCICHQDGHSARSCAKRAELQAKLKKKASNPGAK